MYTYELIQISYNKGKTVISPTRPLYNTSQVLLGIQGIQDLNAPNILQISYLPMSESIVYYTDCSESLV